MLVEDLRLVVRVGPFGAGSAGHSHCDVLSFTLSEAATDVLVDPGTYTYVADAALRDWFRGSAAHNSIRVDRSDQVIAAGPFRWSHTLVSGPYWIYPDVGLTLSSVQNRMIPTLI